MHFDVIKDDLLEIVNKSFETSKFPCVWKNASIKPLIKKLSLPRVHTSYRPVSNLKFLSKILEKCMLNQLIEHCEGNGLIPSGQSAYRAKHSCETAVL